MTRIKTVVDDEESDEAEETSPPEEETPPGSDAPVESGDPASSPAAAAEAAAVDAEAAAVDAVAAEPKRTSLQLARRARRHWTVERSAGVRERDLQLRYFVQWWDRALAGRRPRQRTRIEGMEAELHKQCRRQWWKVWDAFCEAQGKEKVEGALRLKAEGNAQFKEEDFQTAAETYSEAIFAAPARSKEIQATLRANRGACWAKLGKDKECVEDCTVALEWNPDNTKWLTRRMQAGERLGEDNLYKAFDDAKRLVELDPCNRVALDAKRRLEPLVEARKKAQTDEAIKSLKSLGNSLLGAFGLNLDMFQTNQNADGTYSINFQQNGGQQQGGR